MKDNLPSDQQCDHPAEQVQTGIYARGVYVPAFCMKCETHLVESDRIDIIVMEDQAND